MPRPRDKAQLLEQSEMGYQKMIGMIEGMTVEQQEGTFGFEDRDRNVRDVLMHLYGWHQMLLDWERANMAGEVRQFLREGYNWKTYPKMNEEIWEECQGVELGEAKKLLARSHDAVREMIEKHSDEELFTKKYYSWTGSSSLGSYCVSATSSHYEWAMKKIKKYVAGLQG